MKENRPPGCENCKKNCTIHLTQIINGQVQKVDMCDTCPKAKQMEDPLEFGLMEQLMGMAMQPGTPMTQGPNCATCGYTEAQFKKTGRLGCPDCYNVFITQKMDILSKIHNAIIHKGKIPRMNNKRGLREKLTKLREELKGLISQENYEEAAQVRDEIKQLSEELEATPKKKAKKKSS